MRTKAIFAILIVIALGAGVFGLRAATAPAPSLPSSGSEFISIPDAFKGQAIVANKGLDTPVEGTTTASTSSSTAPAPAKQKPGRSGSAVGQTTQTASSSPATSAPASSTSSPVTASSSPTSSSTVSDDEVCNTALFDSDGYSPYKMIDLSACKKLNELYKAGKAAGNKGDLYDNRDGLHVNFCVDWSPNPECPKKNRLFPQHEWRISSAGRATTPTSEPTIGQASYSGSVEGAIKHSIPYEMYKTQSGADTLYRLYEANNLYIYPSLAEDSFTRSPYDLSLLGNPSGIDPSTDNVANTPYVIGSKQICKCGASSLRVHDASGSDLPFVELGFAGLAAFRPDVKSALEAKGMLMSTLQAMIRYSHDSVSSSASYLSSPTHGSSYVAHRLVGGKVRPAYDSDKLVSMINGLSLGDVPPQVDLSVVSETFSSSEKLFDTPEAVARSVASGTSRTLTVSAQAKSADGYSGSYEYRFEVLKGKAEISVDPNDPSRASITFRDDSLGRSDVGVFARKTGGTYFSVPAIVSLYVRP